MSRVYVASSWRCPEQPAVVAALRAAGHEVYDFRNPPSRSGFGWHEIDPEWLDWTIDAYRDRLGHPRAVEGYMSDFEAMQWADTFVLVLPCGRSAHLELGWAAGQGKRTAILLSQDAFEPELMYRMVDYLGTSLDEVVEWAGVAKPLVSANSRSVANDPVAATPELTDAMPSRLYLAGPMSGFSDFNYPAFRYAAGELRTAGYEVENPADNTIESEDYHDYLRAGLAQLQRCGGAAVLEGWWLSGGARWEVQTAGILGLPVRSVDEWLRLADAAPEPERVQPSVEAIAKRFWHLACTDNRVKGDIYPEDCDVFAEAVHALLTSQPTAREVAAKAWDEGHVAGVWDQREWRFGQLTANPYREEAQR